MKRHFTEDITRVVNKYMKRSSTSLIIRDVQIKTTMRYHLTPVRIAIIKQMTNKKSWQGCGKKGTLVQCWWDVTWSSHYGKQYDGFSEIQKY